jgi:hypothetical protein
MARDVVDRMTHPCAIPNCVSLATMPAMFCPVHRAMPDAERDAAWAEAKKQCQPRRVVPVTTRIEYEKDEPT